jgi:hypothetical protein
MRFKPTDGVRSKIERCLRSYEDRADRRKMVVPHGTDVYWAVRAWATGARKLDVALAAKPVKFAAAHDVLKEIVRRHPQLLTDEPLNCGDVVADLAELIRGVDL